jgi:uncharacterized membrane protein YdjX (TVP38/TMEM64 family)
MKKILSKFTKKQSIIWFGLLFLLLFFVFNQNLITSLINRDLEAIRHFLDHHLWYAFLFMFIIMVIQNSFTVFPLIFVITINITLFGFMNGFLWSWFSSIIASIIVFNGVRYVFQDMIMGKFNPKLIEKLDANGFAYVFQARIFPFFPTSLVNILSGLSTIRLYPFLLATVIGNFLYFFLLALIPAGILSIDLNEYEIWVIILSLVLLYYLFKFLRKKRKLSSIEESDKD